MKNQGIGREKKSIFPPLPPAPNPTLLNLTIPKTTLDRNATSGRKQMPNKSAASAEFNQRRVYPIKREPRLHHSQWPSPHRLRLSSFISGAHEMGPNTQTHTSLVLPVFAFAHSVTVRCAFQRRHCFFSGSPRRQSRHTPTYSYLQ